MMRTGEPLGQHIPPDLDEARLARQYAAITAKMQPRKRTRWTLAFVPAAACLAALVFLLLRPHGRRSSSQPSQPTAGAVVEAPAEEPLAITLVEGSRVVLQPKGQLGLVSLSANDIRLQLDRGGVELDVTHVENRTFVVTAAGYEVQVLGTRFRVRVRPPEEGPSLEVHVDRGRVRVARVGDDADVRVLASGETWSTGRSAPQYAPPAPSALGAAPSAEASAPTVRPPPTVAPTSTAPVLPGAKELWNQAETARASKRFRDEAAALDALRRRHRSDPRAGLAAFELGRLRQDTLHDPAGAAEAFADAVVLAPTGPFREDAEARRVEALEAAGDRGRCSDAKAAFLTRYPQSIHRQRVSARCEAR